MEHGQQVPPMPERPPSAAASLPDWLRAPRPEGAPLGVWRANYVPPAEEQPDRVPTRQLAVGAVATALGAWIFWSLLYGGYLGDYWVWPLAAAIPYSWRGTMSFVVASWVYYGIIAAALLVGAARLGSWPEVARRTLAWLKRQTAVDPAQAGAVPYPRTPPPAPEDDPAAFRELRRDGATAEADRLARELETGTVSDVDWARLTHTWRLVRDDATRRAAFLEELRARGAAAAVHGSGARDLPGRTARYDAVLRQVRIGTAAPGARNPAPYRGAGIGLAPEQLATGLVVVGPAGSGKTSRVVRPVVESLCAQALAGQAAVVLVTTSGDRCAPREWFDAVVSTSEQGPQLDLFGAGGDPDEAAAQAAEALAGDLGDGRQAVTLLAQLIGPYRAVHGRWPTVPELRDLLAGDGHAEELRDALEKTGDRSALRELAAGARQLAAGSAAAALLSDRAALLDRPALANLVSTNAGVTPLDRLDRPVRARIDLPERVHHEAAHILARLVLAQAAAGTSRRGGGTPFVCVVFDDAAGVVTGQGIRTLHRLRSAGVGVVLAVRTLGDVSEELRAPLVAAAGCRAVLAGVDPWEAQHFAAAWGTEWVEDVAVTDRQLVADEPMQRITYGLRRLVTGRHVTAQAITTSRTRRERWPADDLATEVPGGYAVISVTGASGDRSSPILVQLGS